MINNYRFLLATLCICTVLQAMEKESQIDWDQNGPGTSFSKNIKEFRCPDDLKADEPATAPNPDNVKIQIPLQKWRKVKERQSTPRPDKLRDSIARTEDNKSVFHGLLKEAIATNKAIEVNTKK